MLKLMLNVEYLLLVSLLAADEFCNLGHFQGIKMISLELRHSYKSDCITFRSDFNVSCKKLSNIDLLMLKKLNKYYIIVFQIQDSNF